MLLQNEKNKNKKESRVEQVPCNANGFDACVQGLF